MFLYLIDHAGQLVKTDVLLDLYWRGSLTDATAVRKAIAEIRKVVDADLERSLIKTVPKQGYVWLAEEDETRSEHARPGALDAADRSDVTNGRWAWRPASGMSVHGRRNWVLDHQLDESVVDEIWIARHAKTREEHVFKFCFDAEGVRLLQREVALFRVLHDSLGHRDDIGRILDWRSHEPPFYIEAEYSRDGNLAEWASAQAGACPVPLADRLELIAQIADALAAAHSVGVLHKDVKPQNILIYTHASTGRARARLIDFGIGLVTGDGVMRHRNVTMADLLSGSSGEKSGSFLYVAPEILAGDPATTLSDLYSLGIRRTNGLFV